tara:strand:+ start:1905 stop:2993 length:1089 start_codon:yes stop_codon:yes gene_type:complete
MARTYTAYENPASRQFQIQVPGTGRTSFQYGLTIKPTSGTIGTDREEYKAAVQALRTWTGAALGKVITVGAFPSGDEEPWGDLGAVDSISFQRVPDSDHVYEAVITWGTSFPDEYASGGDIQFVDTGVASVTFNSRQATRMMDVYKSTDLPTTAEQVAAGTTFYNSTYIIQTIDTSGAPISGVESLDIAGGKPVKRPIRQVEIEVTEPWNKVITISPTGGDVSVGAWPDVTNYASAYVNTRNETAFLGCPAGTLLYKGASASSTSQHSYALVHRFIYDEKQHFNQVPLHNQWGLSNIATVSNAGGSGLTVQVNNKVFWTNDYPMGASGSSNDWANFAWVNGATTHMETGIDAPSANSGPISR